MFPIDCLWLAVIAFIVWVGGGITCGSRRAFTFAWHVRQGGDDDGHRQELRTRVSATTSITWVNGISVRT